jgi:hypothetical protein
MGELTIGGLAAVFDEPNVTGRPLAAVVLAAALSVVGEVVPLPVAGRIARVDHPAEALEALLGTGLVTWWSGEANTPAGFAHPLYRAALYADLAPTRRRELHRAAEVVYRWLRNTLLHGPPAPVNQPANR